ncbi:MAG: hypothetical protein KJ832_19470, partial [Gammaproteobacteria bacterium]|nr:hypothetical protein [Gammaproteobacteria bacterium]
MPKSLPKSGATPTWAPETPDDDLSSFFDDPRPVRHQEEPEPAWPFEDEQVDERPGQLCRQCGARNRQEAVFCRRCAERLVPVASNEARMEATAPQPLPAPLRASQRSLPVDPPTLILAGCIVAFFAAFTGWFVLHKRDLQEVREDVASSTATAPAPAPAAAPAGVPVDTARAPADTARSPVDTARAISAPAGADERAASARDAGDTVGVTAARSTEAAASAAPAPAPAAPAPAAASVTGSPPSAGVAASAVAERPASAAPSADATPPRRDSTSNASAASGVEAPRVVPEPREPASGTNRASRTRETFANTRERDRAAAPAPNSDAAKRTNQQATSPAPPSAQGGRALASAPSAPSPGASVERAGRAAPTPLIRLQPAAPGKAPVYEANRPVYPDSVPVRAAGGAEPRTARSSSPNCDRFNQYGEGTCNPARPNARDPAASASASASANVNASASAAA